MLTQLAPRMFVRPALRRRHEASILPNAILDLLAAQYDRLVFGVTLPRLTCRPAADRQFDDRQLKGQFVPDEFDYVAFPDLDAWFRPLPVNFRVTA